MKQINPFKELRMNDVHGMSCDTRTLKKYDVFFDFMGCEDHCNQALQKGALGIITPLKDFKGEGVPIYVTQEPRLLFSKMCARFYPSQPHTIAAVTGTNGKTSTVDFIRQLWQGLGKSSYSFGTLGLQGEKAHHIPLDLPASLNTLDAYHLHKLLHTLTVQDKEAFFTFEASSHGLDQYRAHHVRVTHGVFTNLTQDHLDYHHNMEAYFEAKARLFTDVMDQGGTAIINADDVYCMRLHTVCKDRGIQPYFFSMKDANVPLFARIEKLHGSGMSVRINAFNDFVDIDLPFVGSFQVENLLGALGVVMTSSSVSLREIMPLFLTIKAPAGRMEHVGSTSLGADVFIDYAHTPDALKRALESLRHHTQNNLHVIFGCGGDRDRTKRPIMGKIAADLADHVLITDDNPRTEDPQIIREEILAGIGEKSTQTIDDRARAIEIGIKQLKKGDILLVAGKGHEQGQIIGQTIHPFCDKKTAEKYLRS